MAKAVLEKENIMVTAYTIELGGIKAQKRDMNQITLNPFCCPDTEAAKMMEDRVTEVKKKGDSLGGIVEILATGVQRGLGEPVFDKLDADLAKGLMSISLSKGLKSAQDLRRHGCQGLKIMIR